MKFFRRNRGHDGRTTPASGPDADARPRDDVDFTIAVVALGAKLAKADGVVTPDEEAAFLEAFTPEETAGKAAARAFDRASKTTLGFESYAKRIARRWRANPSVLEDVLDGLFHVALADGVVTDDELAYLATVADIFGFSDREFRRLKASWLGNDADDPYLILGVDPDISDEGLKRAYRRIAAANHPDRFAGRGVPPHLERMAQEKMSAINAAYARVRAERALPGAEND